MLDANQVRRGSSGVLVAIACLLPGMIWLAMQVKLTTAQVESWLPDETPALEAYRQFKQDFGADQQLIVSWESASLDDRAQFEAFRAELLELKAHALELEIKSVIDSFVLLEELQRAQPEIQYQQAMRELAGKGIGRDGTPFMSLRLGQASIESRTKLFESLFLIAEKLGVQPASLVFAGEPFQVFVIDQASRNTMERYVAPSSLLALFIAWLCIGRLRETLVVFAFAGFGQLTGLALISLFFGEMSAVLVVLPTLVFMLTLSAAVHLSKYYLEHVNARSAEAAVAALKDGLSPCTMATITTVFGFGSLMVSSLGPVWKFGSLAALGLVVSTSALLAGFPALISLSRRTPRGLVWLAEWQLFATQSQWFANLLVARLSLISFLAPRSISGLGIIILIVASLGLNSLRPSTEFEDMFSSNDRAVENLRWVEERLGPIDVIELVVDFNGSGLVANAEDLDVLPSLVYLQSLERKLSAMDSVEATISAATLLPRIPTGGGIRNVLTRSLLRQKAESLIALWKRQGWLARGGNPGVLETAAWKWRVSIKVKGLNSQNFDELASQLLAAAGTVEPPENTRRPRLSLNGILAVMETAHTRLISDLMTSFATAFLLITPVVVLATRSVKYGTIAMLPNLMPVVCVFGAMGWFEVQLDVASILTASVALGIAVDDTLHFMTWFRRAMQAGAETEEAVRLAIERCAPAMLSTTLICTAAMTPFLFCDFLPTSKFATLMILSLLGAIVADLIFLPALLLVVGKDHRKARIRNNISDAISRFRAS